MEKLLEGGKQSFLATMIERCHEEVLHTAFYQRLQIYKLWGDMDPARRTQRVRVPAFLFLCDNW